MSTEKSLYPRSVQSVNRPSEPISDRCDADEFLRDAWQKTLRWSSDPLTVDELVERHGRQLPIIACATRGYHDVDGLGGLSLAEGQVRLEADALENE